MKHNLSLGGYMFACSKRFVQRAVPSTVMVLSVLLASMGVTVALASPAGAHTPGATADCSGVRLKGSAYDGSKQNKWSANIGGKVQSGTFGASLDKTLPVPQGGATTSWSAVIQAYDGSYKGTFNGTVGPCGTQPPVKDASASLSITPATCNSPEKLVLGQVTNATWGTPTRTTGPGSYSVVATGNAGPPQHLFSPGPGVSADGKTKTFTGNLKGVDTSQNCWAKDAAASVNVLGGTCTSTGSAAVGETKFATLVGTLDQSVGTHVATFQSEQGHLFSNGTDTLQVTYTITGKDTSRACTVKKYTVKSKASCVTSKRGEGVVSGRNWAVSTERITVKVMFTRMDGTKSMRIMKVKPGKTFRIELPSLKIGSVARTFVDGKLVDKDRVEWRKSCKADDTHVGYKKPATAG